MVVRDGRTMTNPQIYSFSALSVEPYGGSWWTIWDGRCHRNFQCSLCRAVWWFKRTRQTSTRSPLPFSALSVEPYGGSNPASEKTLPYSPTFSALSVEPYGGSWARVRAQTGTDAFSALSVEPYGGSVMLLLACGESVSFQCSLCRAVWWFPETEFHRHARSPDLSVLSL